MQMPIEIAETTARGRTGLSKAEIATIDAARAILRRHARSTLALQSWTHLTDYLALNALSERTEVFRVRFLDRKNRLIRDRIMAFGGIDRSQLPAIWRPSEAAVSSRKASAASMGRLNRRAGRRVA